jgi:hypothetical protein
MPARLRAIKQAIESKAGFSVLEPSSGSHWKIFGPDGKMYPIPAYNGLKTEIPDKYIAGMCRAFGLDPAEFKKLL